MTQHRMRIPPAHPAPPAAIAVRQAAIPLTGDRSDHDALVERIGNADVVLLGEASHGTHEFYAERARITQRLIAEEGFTAVAVEADWPDAYRVNRHVRGRGEDRSAEAALRGFRRFPTWMWRNEEVAGFVDWLHTHNQETSGSQAGFYGLDLYSLHGSMEAVVDYLAGVDPEGAERARERYACFEPFANESQAYGRAVVMGASEPCRRDAIAQLVELRRRGGGYLQHDGEVAEEEQFVAEQNARLITNAEEYYRTMFGERAASWNLRDRHMADTLDELMAFLGRTGDRPRVVVWAHNSHVGDARRTQMRERGELNLGQLARERLGTGAVLVGFTTYAGSVTAAHDWGDAPRTRRIRDALPESGEAVLHNAGLEAFCVITDADPRVAAALNRPRLHRAIGVLYRPRTELESHYLVTQLGKQFDAIIHFDRTGPVTPLDRAPAWELDEPPETYPTAL